MSRDEENNSNNQRRQFLKDSFLFGGTGLFLGPLDLFSKIIAEDLIQKAVAAVSRNAPPRNYVNIMLKGAPSRIVFDHWLRTNESDPAVSPNVHVATEFTGTGGIASGLAYSTFKYKNILVPAFFKHQVTASKGGQRPLTELLDQMMIIRGYGTGFDGHLNNSVAQLNPLSGASTISGTAADYSARTFPAVQFPSRGAFGTFFSSNGKALNLLTDSKPLHQLLRGFATPPEKTSSLLQRQSDAIEAVRMRLGQYVKKDYLGAAVLEKTMKDAALLMKKGIADLDGFWAEAVERYSRIFNQSARTMNLPGFSNLSLTPPNSNNTLWRLFAGPAAIHPKGDARSIIANYSCPTLLAEGFAIAEFVLKQGLVTSLELATPDFDPNKIILTDGSEEDAVDPFGTKNRFTYVADMHENGAFCTLAMTGALFRGLSAMILELADQLRSTTMGGTDVWSQTILQLSSDFGRLPRTNGSGSDHGFNQMITSVFSGIIKGPIVIGNIHQNGNLEGLDTAQYGGTIGTGAPIDNYNQKGRPTPLMMGSTIAEALGVPSNPFANVASPLIQVANGLLAPLMSGKMLG